MEMATAANGARTPSKSPPRSRSPGRSMPKTSSPLPPLGARVEVLYNRKRASGTVRFAGITSFASGPLVGVALDFPVGKNDGSVLNMRYFDCPPKHGLFVRPKAILGVAGPSDVSTTQGISSQPPSPTTSGFGEPPVSLTPRQRLYSTQRGATGENRSVSTPPVSLTPARSPVAPARSPVSLAGSPARVSNDPLDPRGLGPFYEAIGRSSEEVKARAEQWFEEQGAEFIDDITRFNLEDSFIEYLELKPVQRNKADDFFQRCKEDRSNENAGASSPYSISQWSALATPDAKSGNSSQRSLVFADMLTPTLTPHGYTKEEVRDVVKEYIDKSRPAVGLGSLLGSLSLGRSETAVSFPFEDTPDWFEVLIDIQAAIAGLAKSATDAEKQATEAAVAATQSEAIAAGLAAPLQAGPPEQWLVEIDERLNLVEASVQKSADIAKDAFLSFEERVMKVIRDVGEVPPSEATELLTDAGNENSQEVDSQEVDRVWSASSDVKQRARIGLEDAMFDGRLEAVFQRRSFLMDTRAVVPASLSSKPIISDMLNIRRDGDIGSGNGLDEKCALYMNRLECLVGDPSSFAISWTNVRGLLINSDGFTFEMDDSKVQVSMLGSSEDTKISEAKKWLQKLGEALAFNIETSLALYDSRCTEEIMARCTFCSPSGNKRLVCRGWLAVSQCLPVPARIPSVSVMKYFMLYDDAFEYFPTFQITDLEDASPCARVDLTSVLSIVCFKPSITIYMYDDTSGHRCMQLATSDTAEFTKWEAAWNTLLVSDVSAAAVLSDVYQSVPLSQREEESSNATRPRANVQPIYQGMLGIVTPSGVKWWYSILFDSGIQCYKDLQQYDGGAPPVYQTEITAVSITGDTCNAETPLGQIVFQAQNTIDFESWQSALTATFPPQQSVPSAVCTGALDVVDTEGRRTNHFVLFADRLDQYNGEEEFTEGAQPTKQLLVSEISRIIERDNMCFSIELTQGKPNWVFYASNATDLSRWIAAFETLLGCAATSEAVRSTTAGEDRPIYQGSLGVIKKDDPVQWKHFVLFLTCFLYFDSASDYEQGLRPKGQVKLSDVIGFAIGTSSFMIEVEEGKMSLSSRNLQEFEEWKVAWRKTTVSNLDAPPTPQASLGQPDMQPLEESSPPDSTNPDPKVNAVSGASSGALSMQSESTPSIGEPSSDMQVLGTSPSVEKVGEAPSEMQSLDETSPVNTPPKGKGTAPKGKGKGKKGLDMAPDAEEVNTASNLESAPDVATLSTDIQGSGTAPSMEEAPAKGAGKKGAAGEKGAAAETEMTDNVTPEKAVAKKPAAAKGVGKKGNAEDKADAEDKGAAAELQAKLQRRREAADKVEEASSSPAQVVEESSSSPAQVVYEGPLELVREDGTYENEAHMSLYFVLRDDRLEYFRTLQHFSSGKEAFGKIEIANISAVGMKENGFIVAQKEGGLTSCLCSEDEAPRWRSELEKVVEVTDYVPMPGMICEARVEVFTKGITPPQMQYLTLYRDSLEHYIHHYDNEGAFFSRRDAAMVMNMDDIQEVQQESNDLQVSLVLQNQTIEYRFSTKLEFEKWMSAFAGIVDLEDDGAPIHQGMLRLGLATESAQSKYFVLFSRALQYFASKEGYASGAIPAELSADRIADYDVKQNSFSLSLAGGKQLELWPESSSELVRWQSALQVFFRAKATGSSSSAASTSEIRANPSIIEFAPQFKPQLNETDVIIKSKSQLNETDVIIKGMLDVMKKDVAQAKYFVITNDFMAYYNSASEYEGGSAARAKVSWEDVEGLDSLPGKGFDILTNRGVVAVRTKSLVEFETWEAAFMKVDALQGDSDDDAEAG